MRPLYGPVAGGTRVTITGPSASIVAAVNFGQLEGIIDTVRLAFSFLVCSVQSNLKRHVVQYSIVQCSTVQCSTKIQLL